ncbi:MAG: RsmD family RNA methyltransferase [Deltaproteobacteria bacterium]|nr:RsmD family RNA methyltransferase [Deltaproteobacteria bacterium]
MPASSPLPAPVRTPDRPVADDWLQPARGYRFTGDSVRLARFCPERAEGSVCDLGAGCGVVLLEAACSGRLRGASGLVLVERDPSFLPLLEANVRRAMALVPDLPPVTVLIRDWRELAPEELGGQVRLACSNPPYFRPGTGRPPRAAGFAPPSVAPPESPAPDRVPACGPLPDCRPAPCPPGPSPEPVLRSLPPAQEPVTGSGPPAPEQVLGTGPPAPEPYEPTAPEPVLLTGPPAPGTVLRSLPPAQEPVTESGPPAPEQVLGTGPPAPEPYEPPAPEPVLLTGPPAQEPVPGSGPPAPGPVLRSGPPAQEPLLRSEPLVPEPVPGSGPPAPEPSGPPMATFSAPPRPNSSSATAVPASSAATAPPASPASSAFQASPAAPDTDLAGRLGRWELFGGIGSLAEAAARLLLPGGALRLCFPRARLPELLDAAGRACLVPELLSFPASRNLPLVLAVIRRKPPSNP